MGCHFDGGNTNLGAKLLDANQCNFLLFAQDSDSIQILGNTFTNTFANSSVQFYSLTAPFGTGSPGVTNSTVQYNTYADNPLYAVAIVAGTNNTVQSNLSFDGGFGAEADSTAQAMGNITIRANKIFTENGNCAKNSATTQYCIPGVFITGGVAPAGMDYSTNVVSNNYCEGNPSQGALIYNGTPPRGGKAAKYSSNILGTSCACLSGTRCWPENSVNGRATEVIKLNQPA